MKYIKNSTWEDINGYEGIYQINGYGKIKVVKSGAIRKEGDNGSGYKYIPLFKEGVSTNFYIHRLVAEHFLPNTDGKPCVNHIDHDRSNNAVHNLEWVSYAENTEKGIKYGGVNKDRLGKKLRRFTEKDAENIAMLEAKGYTIQKIADTLGFNRTSISSFLNGRGNKKATEFYLLIKSKINP